MIWDKPKIVKELKRLHKSGSDLSYNRLSRDNQALVSAAAYHFDSYREAVEKSGIDYADVVRRPRWTKQRIIQLIKQARKNGEDLHWSAVTARRDELGRAAFASLQPRLFGRWDRALGGAGLDADEISRYRAWDKDTIVFELKQRHSGGEALNSGAIQKDDPGLHAAAVRYFGTYDSALKAAKFDPMQTRQRRSWSQQGVLTALKQHAKGGQSVSDTAVRRDSPALYGAAVRLFGTYTAARAAAGLKK